MRKIVQLDEYDYNKLADLAKLNEKEIEKHAIDLWKEKGVAEITIKIDTGRDYNDYVVLIALHISSIKITGSTFQRMYGRDLGKLSKKM